MAMAGAIVAESTLSLLGIGIVPPYPSWGSMIAGTYGYLRTPYWFLLAEPCIIVGALLFAFTFLGDGLSDAINPQTRSCSRTRRSASSGYCLAKPPVTIVFRFSDLSVKNTDRSSSALPVPASR